MISKMRQILGLKNVFTYLRWLFFIDLSLYFVYQKSLILAFNTSFDYKITFDTFTTTLTFNGLFCSSNPILNATFLIYKNKQTQIFYVEFN